jgi:hypothetical protein
MREKLSTEKLEKYWAYSIFIKIMALDIISDRAGKFN